MSDSGRLSPAGSRVVIGLAAALGLAAAWPGASARRAARSTLVVCAPGYPGSTAEAQSAMDALAAAIAAAAGWKPGELRAEYFETETTGLDRFAAPDAACRAGALPFWLQHRVALKLTPHLQAVEQGGQAAEAWTLVAPAGAVSGAPSLSGFELVSAGRLRSAVRPRTGAGTVGCAAARRQHHVLEPRAVGLRRARPAPRWPCCSTARRPRRCRRCRSRRSCRWSRTRRRSPSPCWPRSATACRPPRREGP